VNDVISILTEYLRNLIVLRSEAEICKCTALFLQQNVGIHSGLIVCRQKDQFHVEASWGTFVFGEHLLQDLLDNCEEDLCANGTASLATELQKWASQHATGVSVVVLPLESNGRPYGMFILECHEMNCTQESILEICAMQTTMCSDVLHTRRVAEQVSRVDALTGLLNRAGFHDLFPSVRNDASKDAQALLIGVLDLDDFKMINDSYGHTQGDKMLQRIAQLLMDCIGEQGICARWGGDEMVFAWKVNADVDVATKVLLEQLSPSQAGCYISVGLAVWGLDGNDWNLCFAVADQRLYERKVQRSILQTTV